MMERSSINPSGDTYCVPTKKSATTSDRNDPRPSVSDNSSHGNSSHGNHVQISNFKRSWKQYDTASSQLLFSMCQPLLGTDCEGLSKDLLAVLGPVFGCSESELVHGRLKEMENLLSGLQTDARTDRGRDSGGDSGGKKASQVQLMCRCLLLFIKLQAEYHQLCSHTISSVINHLVATSETHDNHDLLQQLKSLDLGKYSTPQQSPTRSAAGEKMSGISGNASPKTQKHGSFKSSLFSFFEKKNIPEEGNSLFYIDINQQKEQEEKCGNQTAVSQSESFAHCHMTENSQSEVLIDVGLDPGSSCGSDRTGTTVSAKETPTDDIDGDRCLISQSNPSMLDASPHSVGRDKGMNGEVATQEELDSVINLLSGTGVGGATMQTIPEHHDGVRLSVPSLYGSSLSPAVSDVCMDDVRSLHTDDATTLRTKGQRHSEGSLDLTGFGNTGHNTWPYQHRSSLPGGQVGMLMPHDFTSPPYPQYYNQDLRPATMALPPGGGSHFLPGHSWGFPDSKLNRTWPMNNLTGTGSVTDTMNSSWSGAPDSDEMSDDSSCGEHFQVMSHLHSLDTRQDYLSEDPTMAYRAGERGGDVKHHSLEDLLETRSSNTWPQQLQPWSPAHQREPPDLTMGAGYHRPVTMQLSDPLSRRNLWTNLGDPGCLQPQAQSVQGLGQM